MGSFTALGSLNIESSIILLIKSYAILVCPTVHFVCGKGGIVGDPLEHDFEERNGTLEFHDESSRRVRNATGL